MIRRRLSGLELFVLTLPILGKRTLVQQRFAHLRQKIGPCFPVALLGKDRVYPGKVPQTDEVVDQELPSR